MKPPCPPSEPAAESAPAFSSLLVPLVLSLLLAGGLVAFSGWARLQLAADAKIPIHWNTAGQIDGYRGRNTLFLLPGIVAGLGVMFYCLPLIEPRRGHLLRSSRAYRAVWLALLLFLAAAHIFLVRAALGHDIPGTRWLHFGVGVLFLVIGNFLGKIRSNFAFGVRTPWTLSSELSWNKTHRLAGWLFVSGGLALIAGSFLRLSGGRFQALLLGWLAVTLITVAVYSYCVWRVDPDKAPRT